MEKHVLSQKWSKIPNGSQIKGSDVDHVYLKARALEEWK
jgi:hypothetical protein